MNTSASGEDSLASKCMAFCQALASQGQVFNFSLSLGPDFTFSLDTRSKGVKSQVIKKKASPSTLRRNARRRVEFMAKKQQSSPSRIPSGDNDAAKAPKCDQCEYEAVSEKGLKQHIRMKHKEPEPATEILRSRKDSRGSLDCSISLLSSTREDICQNCEAPFSSVHQCGDGEGNGGENEAATETPCTCTNMQCCGCRHEPSCECFKMGKPDGSDYCNCESATVACYKFNISKYANKSKHYN